MLDRFVKTWLVVTAICLVIVVIDQLWKFYQYMCVYLERCPVINLEFISFGLQVAFNIFFIVMLVRLAQYAIFGKQKRKNDGDYSDNE